MTGLAHSLAGLPRVIGHRGAAAYAPENTVAGFTHAAGLGVRWVELDVQLTADGVPVVFHDEWLDRTTSGHGRLVDTDLATVQRLDAGAWFGPAFAGEPVPSLAAAIEAIVRLGLGVNIEIKADDDRAEATARIGLAAALAHWPADRPPPLVSSFSRVALAAAGSAAPDWPRGLVSDHWPDDWQDATDRLRCASLHVRHQQLTDARIAAAKAGGLAVLAYIVDDLPLARTLWQQGVDALFSDYPDRLLTTS